MHKIIMAVATLTFFLPATINAASAQDFTAAQKEQIQEMFKEYLVNNGEVILESVNKYQGELVAKEAAVANEKAAGFVKELSGRTDLATAGNPEGDITIVEFFDYNCGYCTRALEEIQVILKEDKNVRVVFMDMPILGPQSLEASKWSLAAREQGKYWEYHRAIMTHQGPKNEAALEKLAKELKLDIDKLKKDKDSEEIAATLNQNIEEAQALNIRGTPGFIIGEEVAPGYIPAEQMKKIIAEQRKNNG